MEANPPLSYYFWTLPPAVPFRSKSFVKRQRVAPEITNALWGLGIKSARPPTLDLPNFRLSFLPGNAPWKSDKIKGKDKFNSRIRLGHAETKDIAYIVDKDQKTL